MREQQRDTGISEDLKFKDGSTSTCIQTRYVLAVMFSSALILNYCVNVCMSVAIVAMVKSAGHAASISNDTETDVCPGGNIENNTEEQQEGEFDWNEETQGYILSSYYYGYICTQILGGRLAERFGSKHVIGSGILICGILTLLIPLSAWTHIYLLIAFRAMQGVAGGVVLPAMHCMFSKWFPPEERAPFCGVVFSAIHGGTVIAMGLTGVLADAGGWPVVFYFFGIASIVWYIPWLFLAFETPEQHPRISCKEKIYLTERLEPINEQKVSPPIPWCKIFTSGPVWAVFLMNFGITWELYTLMTELPTYTKNILHYNIRESGFISALPYLFDWMSSIAAGFLARWLRSKGYVSQLTTYKIFNGVVAIGGALCLYGITVVRCDATVIMILLILTLTTHGFYVAGSAINHMDLAINFSGTIAGICFTLSNFAGILAPSIAGVIINGKQTLTQWSIVFYIAMAVVLTCYVMYLILGSADEQPWNQPERKNDDSFRKDYDNNAFWMDSATPKTQNSKII